MDIKELRNNLNLSQREFSKLLNIPLGTLRNWEQERTSPPDYVLNLIMESVKEDYMLNHDTIRFIAMLNKLARKSKVGIVSFDNATSENYDLMVFYDSTKADNHGLFPVVQDMCIDDYPGGGHHDIVNYYGFDRSDFTVRVNADDEEEVFIEVTFPSQSYSIIIENGIWYAV